MATKLFVYAMFGVLACILAYFVYKATLGGMSFSTEGSGRKSSPVRGVLAGGLLVLVLGSVVVGVLKKRIQRSSDDPS